MKYKLVAIDMDGTLLDSEKKVSNRTKKVLIEVQKKGVKIVITTGRILVSAAFYANYIGLKTPIIACNGAIIKGVRENILKTFPIDKKTLIKAVEICEDMDIYYHFYSEGMVYSLRSMEGFQPSLLKETKIDPSFSIPTCPLNDISSIWDIKEDILKLTMWDRDEDKVSKVLEKIYSIEDAFITSSSFNNIELTNVEATKGRAIEFLADYYKIDKDQVMAIGDSYNDQSMIQYAGLGVAMENAREDIKEKADYITLSNDNEGVAAVLEKFIR